MTEALLISNFLLWACVVALSFVVFGLVRQLGVLHERVAPVGAMAAASPLEVGESAPAITVSTLQGAEITIGPAQIDNASTLLFFLSPSCPVCKTLLPTLLRIASEEGAGLQLILASDGNLDQQREFAGQHGLLEFPYVVSTELGLAYHASKLPYAVLIDEKGVVRAKGLVNTREHLESLFAARDHGVASIQEYVAKKRAGLGADADASASGAAR
jgi:methylamine dehydrogenase accessory protein MauD